MDHLTAHPMLLLAILLIGGIIVMRLVAKLACLAVVILIGIVLAGTATGLLNGFI